jgi:hypothetical protein
MKKVTVSCPGQKKPAKVCELVKEDSGILRMEIKFQNTPLLKIELNDYLMQLGVCTLDIHQ